ncbi:hypothetical protein AVEN_122492-1 [Araneus ventricosus]|uniref:Uncharacterized protein n=1 Tax=Araneus ventricosus TaxID=182803 RepID=A0A4Y2Q5U2_ARAVE|nr:hypothetical protein AVEN_122492-1 [Araneus ventricosus]
MGPCDDLPAKPELLHWGRMRRTRREPVTQVSRASVNSAIKEHGITCRVTAATFGGNASCVLALNQRECSLLNILVYFPKRCHFSFPAWLKKFEPTVTQNPMTIRRFLLSRIRSTQRESIVIESPRFRPP